MVLTIVYICGTLFDAWCAFMAQAEADRLFGLEKRRSRFDSSGNTRMPENGSRFLWSSNDLRESFHLNLRRARINLAKGTFQNRARQVVILARLDLGGKPHRNPDGNVIESPHLHRYREGYGDKWAFPVPGDLFPHPDSPWRTLKDFMRFCNIIKHAHNSARSLRMIGDVQSLLDQYWTWLREQTRLREIDEWIEITIPYLDRHNDFLQIYVKRSDGGFVLTDDGYVLEDLEQSGCKIDSDKRQALLKMTLNGFGVQIHENRKGA